MSSASEKATTLSPPTVVISTSRKSANLAKKLPPILGSENSLQSTELNNFKVRHLILDITLLDYFVNENILQFWKTFLFVDVCCQRGRDADIRQEIHFFIR